MDRYMTLLESTAVWGGDLRTIQSLCRNGKIKGAMKRAGIWFVPKDAPSPLKNNSKLNSKKYPFNGTKKKVFDSAIELFSKNGFENVSIKDIGDVVGITQSTIYNHFASKQEILDTIYGYFSENFNNNRIPADRMKLLLENGSKDEFCTTLMFTFESQNEEIWRRMILITKIIYMRIFQDEEAQHIFLGLMNADTEDYVKEILDYGVSIGRLEEFDVSTYAKFLIGQRHIMGMKAFANPNYAPQQLGEEERIMKMSADMLPFRENWSNGPQR